MIGALDREHAINLIETAVASGARKAAACRHLGIAVRTYQRWRKDDDLTDGRTGAHRVPHNKLSEVERQAIMQAAQRAEFADLPPSRIVPALADGGEYIASESTFYRVLNAERQLTHRHATRPAHLHKPRALTATAPNQVHSWDITYLPRTVRGLFFYLYLFLDIYSRKIVGWQVYEVECGAHAAALVEDITRREHIPRDTLALHADNGGPMKGATMLATLQRLGVMPSFSRPAVSDDNPYVEAWFKTLKYAPVYPGRFDTLSDARAFMEQFVAWYNHKHLHSGIRFVTPHQRHTGEDRVILQHRKTVYEEAKAAHPARWNGRATRNWDHIATVRLNPEKGKTENAAWAEAV